MLAQQVDGVVLAIASRDDPLIDFIVGSGLNAVMVNRADDSGRVPSVVSDDRLAMKLVVDHLLHTGCRRIAHLAGPQNLPTGAGRRAGFEQAMRDHDARIASIVVCEAYSREAGRAAMARLLAAKQPLPDAVACCNDLVALGAYDALAAAGLRIPHDVAVTGHNDMQLVDLVNPPLTTIRPPHRELGWRAAQMLFERLDGQQLSPATVVLRPELVVRALDAAAPVRRARSRRRHVALFGQRALERLARLQRVDAHALRRQVDLDLGVGVDRLHGLGHGAHAVAAGHGGKLEFDHGRVVPLIRRGISRHC